MNKIKILAFAGSLRKASYNKMALKIAASGAQEAGAQVEIIDLKDLEIPVYDGDIEAEGLPKGAITLKEKVKSADALLLAVPEYNHSLAGSLKNAIDWVSRPPKNEFEGKPVATLGASDGSFGTVRAQIAFYPVANTLGIYLMPSKVYVPNADKKFDQEGNILDSKIEERLKKLGVDLVNFASRFKS